VFFDQTDYDLRCEWGLNGVLALAAASDAVVIIDVLSFSTTVDIVVANGAAVLPWRWKDESAARYAGEKQAHLASPSRADDRYSLSPASVTAIPPGAALVLPSPNGATICAATPNVPTFTACLRNAPAVAAHLINAFTRIAVIPAGERWDDDSLRPCLEDWLAAGAVLSLLNGRRSPEAELAVAAFDRFREDLHRALIECASGRELTERGFLRDVELAAAYGASSAVPVLAGDRFVNAAR